MRKAQLAALIAGACLVKSNGNQWVPKTLFSFERIGVLLDTHKTAKPWVLSLVQPTVFNTTCPVQSLPGKVEGGGESSAVAVSRRILPGQEEPCLLDS